MSNQEKIIGGMFGLKLEPDATSKPDDLDFSRMLKLHNARSCLLLLLQAIQPQTIWLPSYLCPTILAPLDIFKEVSLKFYSVNAQLKIDHFDWLNQINSNDMVLIIDYFGFFHDTKLLQEIKSAKAIIIEDASQALLSDLSQSIADFIIYSPRKFIGVPDGGLIDNRTQMNLSEPEVPPPIEWWMKAFRASQLRREFDLTLTKNNWYEIFQQSEALMPVGLYKMSEVSKYILNFHFDYKAIMNHRRKNFLYLLSQFKDIAIFPELYDGVTPLGFPIVIKNRPRVLNEFYKHRIYPPIHWNLKNRVPEGYRESNDLSETILTLPCDQRYSLNDMRIMVEVFQSID